MADKYSDHSSMLQVCTAVAKKWLNSFLTPVAGVFVSHDKCLGDEEILDFSQSISYVKIPLLHFCLTLL